MLPKTSRLGATEVSTLYKQGRRLSSRYFSLIIDDRAPQSAFAVVVGKSGTVGGVERNRMRRRVYSLLGRKLIPHLQGPAHVAISVQKSAFSLTIEELEKELTTLFRRARLI